MALPVVDLAQVPALRLPGVSDLPRLHPLTALQRNDPPGDELMALPADLSPDEVEARIRALYLTDALTEEQRRDLEELERMRRLALIERHESSREPPRAITHTRTHTSYWDPAQVDKLIGHAHSELELDFHQRAKYIDEKTQRAMQARLDFLRACWILFLERAD